MTWVRPDEAAAALGTTIANVRVLAHRHQWRRIRLGRHVAYHLDDIADTGAVRDQGRQAGVTSRNEGGALHP